MNHISPQAKSEHLETASNTVIRFLRRDHDNVDLIYKLKYDANQPGWFDNSFTI